MGKMIAIDLDRCKHCKVCTEICPNLIFFFDETGIKTKTERLNLCFTCGQCMAACSEKAIRIDNLSYENDFFEFTNLHDPFQNLIETRRSIRAFKNKTIEPEKLQQIVDAISFSPPSFPPLKIELLVIINREIINKAIPLMVGLYQKLADGLSKPISRFFIKKSMGKEKFNVVKSHLLPLLQAKLPGMKAGTEDAITRGAQAIIVFHANKSAENFREDIYIALAFGLLKAHSLGIGACAVELIPPAINKVTELKKLFMIPEENEAIISMVLGYPKFTYKRGIKRRLRNVEWV